MLGSLLDLFLAPMCLACDRSIAAGDPARFICRRCRARLRDLPPPCCNRCGAPRLSTGATIGEQCSFCSGWPPDIRYARSSCLLHPPADRIVHQLKYNGWRGLAQPMGDRLARLSLPAEMLEARYVVSVPTTRQRRRSRGYNQAELLAREFAALRGLRFVPVLERASGRSSQIALQPLERAANVAGAFQLAPQRPALDGEHILLVDDVLTTGATSAECAKTLVAGGARCVSVVTFARALDARRLTGS
jgi:ComF family protein